MDAISRTNEPAHGWPVRCAGAIKTFLYFPLTIIIAVVVVGVDDYMRIWCLAFDRRRRRADGTAGTAKFNTEHSRTHLAVQLPKVAPCERTGECLRVLDKTCAAIVLELK